MFVKCALTAHNCSRNNQSLLTAMDNRLKAVVGGCNAIRHLYNYTQSLQLDYDFFNIHFCIYANQKHKLSNNGHQQVKTKYSQTVAYPPPRMLGMCQNQVQSNSRIFTARNARDVSPVSRAMSSLEMPCIFPFPVTLFLTLFVARQCVQEWQ